METKTLKFVFSIILFFSLFLTTKAMRSAFPLSDNECEDHKDCDDAIFDEEMKFLKGDQTICQDGRCIEIPF
jgi:hypothetical protein